MKGKPTTKAADRLYNLASAAARSDAEKAADNAIEFAVLLEQNIKAGGPSHEWVGWFHRDGAEALRRLDKVIKAYQEARQFLKRMKAACPPGPPKARKMDIENNTQYD